MIRGAALAALIKTRRYPFQTWFEMGTTFAFGSACLNLRLPMGRAFAVGVCVPVVECISRWAGAFPVGVGLISDL